MNYYFDSSSEKAALLLSIRLKSIINTKKKPNQEIIILCIGSDRSTGASLGTHIGYKLKKAPQSGFYIYGDLMHPVHAGNLQLYIDKINETFVDPFIIAIDASLGRE